MVARRRSVRVLGVGAALGFNRLIGSVLDHTEELIAELADLPNRSRAMLHLHRKNYQKALKTALNAQSVLRERLDRAKQGLPPPPPRRSVRPCLSAGA